MQKRRNFYRVFQVLTINVYKSQQRIEQNFDSWASKFNTVEIRRVSKVANARSKEMKQKLNYYFSLTKLQQKEQTMIK